jgi:hypothetical protein
MAVGENLPRKFRSGGGNSGVNLGRKFRPGGRNCGPRKFQTEISGLKFRPFTESCTTAREKGLSEKSLGPEILKFLAPGNSALTEFPNPDQKVAPHPFVRDVAEFSRAGNCEISDPRKFCQTRISGPFTERCTTTFCKGLSRISKGHKFLEFLAPGNFVQGQKFRPWGGISGPEAKFLALEIFSSG